MKKLFLFIFVVISFGIQSQTTGDYRSTASGSWSSTSTWERYNGSAWVTPGTTPISTDGLITIRSGHTVTISVAVTVDQVVIETGGVVIHNSSSTVTLANGSSTDLQVNGTWRRQGSASITINASAIIDIASGGVYEHNLGASGGSIPTATWNANSTLLINYTVNTSSAPTNLNQTFGKLEINCPNQTSNNIVITPTNVATEYRVTNSGTGSFELQNLVIDGNYVQTGGTMKVRFSTGTAIANIKGSFQLSGGTFMITDANGSTNDVTLTVDGNCDLLGGSFIFGNTSSTSGIGFFVLKGAITISSGVDLSTGFFRTTSGFYINRGSPGITTINIAHGLTSGTARNCFYYNTINVTGINEVYNGTIAQNTINGSNTTPVSGYLAWPTSGTVIKNFTINNSAGLTLRDNRTINSTLYRTSGSISGVGNIAYASGATLEYNGTSAMSTSDKEFPNSNGPANLVINNTGNITMHANKTISGNLNFVNGKLITDVCTSTTLAADSTLTLADNATMTGASNTRFVDGILKKTGDDAFTFPVGSGNNYAPLSIAAPGVTTDRFAACYIGSNPNSSYSITSKAVSLNNVSKMEYWHINRENGTSNTIVTLSWDSRSGSVTNMSHLRVCRWNGTQWDDESNTGTTGSNTAGTITSGTISNFSPFTLGSTSSANPLPVELIFFNASCQKKMKLIQWTTASEKDNSHFIIAKSADARLWTDIGRVEGNDNSNSQINYIYEDVSNIEGNYYRLYQQDIEGNGEYFKLIYFDSKNCQNDFDIYFDNEKQCLRWSGPNSMNDIDITITDILGRNVHLTHADDFENLPSGIYFLRALYKNKSIEFTFRKQ